MPNTQQRAKQRNKQQKPLPTLPSVRAFKYGFFVLISRTKLLLTCNPAGTQNDTVYRERYQIIIKRRWQNAETQGAQGI